MSDNARYWIWLQNAFGYSARIKHIINSFGSAKDIYDAGENEWRMSSELTKAQVDKLISTPLDSADEIIITCEKNGWQIIDYDDAEYPKRLKEIANPPCVLYVDGKLPDIDSSAAIAIVGTRKASEYAVRVAHIMSKGIAEAGALVVSGGAMGVDTYAHKGALAAGGKTVCVLGSGLGNRYLKVNKSLRETIRLNGALVTEFQPFVNATKATFPIRNRIISGLSLGVLVVEAGIKSGSLVTAECATNQNRDVFAVPTSIISLDFAGTNKLIEDGAKVAVNPLNLIEGYAFDYPYLDLSKVRTAYEIAADESEETLDTSRVKSKTAAEKKKVQKSDDKYSFENLEKGRRKRSEIQQKEFTLSGVKLAVYECLDEIKYTHLSEIMAACGLEAKEALSALTMLQALGLIKSASGQRYIKS